MEARHAVIEIPISIQINNIVVVFLDYFLENLNFLEY